MTFKSFQELLNSRGVFRIQPNLSRVRKVLRQLGDPQNAVPCIHIAGTNGKGSVAAALESVLRASGYKTGLYTSPHLIDLRERVQVQGQIIPSAFLKSAEAVLEAERKAKVSLTYFEVLTAIAFHSFKQQRVDIAIIECGLGGQWDATNLVAHPLISIITSIGLDHTDWLGKSELAIAQQKAGIIKKSGYVVSGVRGQGRSAIAQASREQRAVLREIDLHFKGEVLTASWRTGQQTLRITPIKGMPQTIPFGLLGGHQADNAALVIETLEQLKRLGWKISNQNRDRGLRHIHWPGRLQLIKLPHKAPILIDGAHNVPAMQRLLQSIETSPFKNVQKTFVFSSFKDKEFTNMARMIDQVAAEVCLCPLPGSRGASIEKLSAAFSKSQGPVRALKSSADALSVALQDTPKDGLVVVTGSLHLVGEILGHLQKPAPQKLEKSHA